MAILRSPIVERGHGMSIESERAQAVCPSTVCLSTAVLVCCTELPRVQVTVRMAILRSLIIGCEHCACSIPSVCHPLCLLSSKLVEMDRSSLPIEVEEGLGCQSAVAEAILWAEQETEIVMFAISCLLLANYESLQL
jgi:hypothetical protein